MQFSGLFYNLKPILNIILRVQVYLVYGLQRQPTYILSEELNSWPLLPHEINA
jgi:hypothetical protein